MGSLTTMVKQIQVSNARKRKVESKGGLEALWKEIRNGNEEALDNLYCSTYSHLYNYGFQITPQESLVKDAIQELFLRIWRTYPNLSQAYSVKSYLFQSLRRILLRNLKTEKNRSKRNKKYVEESFREIYNIEELMIHLETEKQQKEMLVKALDSLSKRQKEAIFLKFYEGASNKEIAQIMEINAQSVYNLIYRSVERLKTVLN